MIKIFLAILFLSYPIAAESLKENEFKVMDNIIKTYGYTDFTNLAIYLKEEYWAGPNAAVPAISMGHAYLNRFEKSNKPEDFNVSLSYFEFIASSNVYPNWGQRWASAPTAAHLLCGIYRIKQAKQTNFSDRVDALFNRGREIAEIEANLLLSDDYPYRPYISGTPQDGDTKAEENAWSSTILAWASQMYPDHSNASMWEAKGRQLALFSIVRESDKLFFIGNQVITVEEDFTLTNHWIRGNPYYEVATIHLLRVAALAYHMTGKCIPDEYEHNALGLYGNYKAKCGINNGKYIWFIKSDVVGDPTIFPIALFGDNAFERNISAQKAIDDYLWIPLSPVKTIIVDPEKGLTPESSLGTFIQTGKVFWYYLEGSYLWH